MGLEAANFIAELDKTWPTGLDPINKGDDHVRLVKDVLKKQFPGVGGDGFAEAIIAVEADLNNTAGSTANFQTQIDATVAATVDNSNDIATLFEAHMPIGSIILFNAAFSTIPANWQICDGTNGTPDLVSDFVRGTTNEGNLLDTGGSDDAIVVQHNHGITDNGHNHGMPSGENGNGSGGYDDANNSRNTPNTNNANTGISIKNEGSSGTNQNRPAFVRLAYIQRIT